MLPLPQRVVEYIRAHSLLRAGEGVAVAVSGGADSVALLRILLELRNELGIVISVAHFHHGIRGADADADEAFVAGLASAHDLKLHLDRGEARVRAGKSNISLETAARQLRQGFFAQILQEHKANCVATAHTLDDQAETVLMKALRGAGSRGLSGIFPEHRCVAGRIVRPLLEVRREQLREYLRAQKQEWREDASNLDLSFARNRVRTRALPMLRDEVNPSVEHALAHVAEIARAEEQYWNDQITRLLPLVIVPGEPARGGGRKQTRSEGIAIDIQKLYQQPLAVQRRLLRAAAEKLGCGMEFEQVQAVLHLIAQRAERGAQNKIVELGAGWRVRLLFRELRFEVAEQKESSTGYALPLHIPGEVRVAALGTTIRARISEDNGKAKNASYNPHSVRLPEIAELVVRNWRAGDRFRPARHNSEKRVKELLYPLHLSEEEKRLWPVVAAGDRIVWVRSIDSPELRTETGERLSIEESAE
ncbi:MAG: tRNA lysidine(34) synthetase TilS [Acidobacteria bacterium]|nr:MAG: tRNA lysidine(34) synthetase TilS [Acidobacteriota bacterium]